MNNFIVSPINFTSKPSRVIRVKRHLFPADERYLSYMENRPVKFPPYKRTKKRQQSLNLGTLIQGKDGHFHFVKE